jgi:RNA polymerase sigma factor (TIGR02999 family)
MKLPAEITRLLGAWNRGNGEAFEIVMESTYGDLRRIAGYQLRGESGITLQATALVHEAYLRLAGAQHIPWENRSHFFSIASRLMRQILIQRARARGAGKRGGDWTRSHSEDAEPVRQQARDVVELADALAALAKEDPQKAWIVESRYFGGMTVPEMARRLDVSSSSVERRMRLAIAWLHRYLTSRSGSEESRP